jgi:hypothetical protein
MTAESAGSFRQGGTSGKLAPDPLRQTKPWSRSLSPAAWYDDISKWLDMDKLLNGMSAGARGQGPYPQQLIVFKTYCMKIVAAQNKLNLLPKNYFYNTRTLQLKVV